MVELRIGLSKKFGASKRLKTFFENSPHLDGIFYVGYPILYSTVESKAIDALWLSPTYGVVIFDLVEGIDLEEASRIEVQDDLEIRLENLLRQFAELRERKTLKVNINVVTFAPAVAKKDCSFDCAFSNEDLDTYIRDLATWKHSELFPKVTSVIQSVTRLRGDTKRDYIIKENSRGAKLKYLENTISTLDSEQERAVIEYFEGVQRIRGLAGSGKTIILALKAAYLHAQDANLKIAITFNTRSLKNQFKELIERFVVEKKGALPDWNNINIIHAWGSSKTEGVYYNICKEYGIEYFDYRSAERYRNQTGEIERPAFEAVCEKALTEIKKERFQPKYDIVLVDEAQDLSEHFLKLCFNILSDKKRLIYAYDELQKLYEGSPLRSPKDIFNIKNYSDVILKTCYRNSRPVLTTAHAIGFGIYRDKPQNERLVQFFDNPKLWNDVGYEVIEGEMAQGQPVILARTSESSPAYLEEYLNNDTDEIISFTVCNDKTDQAKKVARSIFKNIKEDELLYKDIIVINPEALTTKDEVAIIRELLHMAKINTHIAGEFDQDVFFQDDSITFTGINRAKGNEVPMVYIINANYCFEGSELRKKRNILFTAITRSKAWVKVFGIGTPMQELREEFHKVKKNSFTLSFTYPTRDQIKKMNVINRDLSETEKQSIQKEVTAITDIVEKIKAGKSLIEDYPEWIQDMLKLILK